jgi:nucleotide-binding universal stress UspA family protein
MLDKRKRKFEELNISVEIRSVIGYPSDVILGEAAKNNVNLIIMWTAGLRGISKIKALGSVARRVSEQAVCPVLLVH